MFRTSWVWFLSGTQIFLCPVLLSCWSIHLSRTWRISNRGLHCSFLQALLHTLELCYQDTEIRWWPFHSTIIKFISLVSLLHTVHTQIFHLAPSWAYHSQAPGNFSTTSNHVKLTYSSACSLVIFWVLSTPLPTSPPHPNNHFTKTGRHVAVYIITRIRRHVKCGFSIG